MDENKRSYWVNKYEFESRTHDRIMRGIMASFESNFWKKLFCFHDYTTEFARFIANTDYTWICVKCGNRSYNNVLPAVGDFKYF